MRGGSDFFLERREAKVLQGTVTQPGHPGHKLWAVYSEMLWVCMRWMSFTLNDARTITMPEIRFFYEGLRGELQRATAPQANPHR